MRKGRKTDHTYSPLNGTTLNLEKERPTAWILLSIKHRKAHKGSHRTENGIIIICMQVPVLTATRLCRLASLVRHLKEGR